MAAIYRLLLKYPFFVLFLMKYLNYILIFVLKTVCHPHQEKEEEKQRKQICWLQEPFVFGNFLEIVW